MPAEKKAGGHPKCITKPAPPWGISIRQRLNWALWFVTENPHIYAEFKRIADGFHFANPKKRFSAEQVGVILRWETPTRTYHDRYKVNHNAYSLLTRLYLRERPKAKISTRQCWVDQLAPLKFQDIVDALETALNGKGS
jgi:hypothetical protein